MLTGELFDLQSHVERNMNVAERAMLKIKQDRMVQIRRIHQFFEHLKARIETRKLELIKQYDQAIKPHMDKQRKLQT